MDCGTVHVRDVTFADNRIDLDTRQGAQGGALFASGISQRLEVKDTVFERNSAQQGGAVFIKSTCTPTIEGGRLEGNSA